MEIIKTLFKSEVIAYLSIISGAILTASIISWFQNKPFRGIGIIDLIFGSHEPKRKVQAGVFIFGVPYTVGILLGLLNAPFLMTGFMVSLGAFSAGSMLFFNPLFLAPPFRQRLFQIRLIYAIFTLLYGALAAMGNFATSYSSILVDDQPLLYEIFIFVTTSVVSACVIFIFQNIGRREYRGAIKEGSKASNTITLDDYLSNIVAIEVKQASKDAVLRALDEIDSTHDRDGFRASVTEELNRQSQQIASLADLALRQIEKRATNLSTADRELNPNARIPIRELYSAIDSLGTDYGYPMPIYDDKELTNHDFNDEQKYIKHSFPGYFS